MMGKNEFDQSKSLLLDGERRTSQESMEEFYLSQPTAKRIVLKVAALTHPAHITTCLRRFGYAVVPQPVRSFVWEDHAPQPKQFSTSYLNGVRGLTAIKVFTFHYWMAYTDFTHMPYGMDEKHTNVLALPIIRYLYSGFTSHIFFGIAGYLTSLRLFQLIDRNDSSSQAKVLTSISGSLFRRAFRLYLPVFLITLIMATYIYLGFYEYARPLIWNKVELFPGDWNEEKPAQAATYIEQLRFWAQEMFVLTNLNSEATFYPLHDQHLWSILSEMRASVHLYGCLVALMMCKRFVRLILLFVIAFIYFCWNHWEVWVYILGAAVAQIDIILSEKSEKQQPLLVDTQDSYSPLKSRFRLSKDMWSALRYTGFLIAFYLLSFPIRATDYYSPGYETLKMFIPEWMDRKDKFYSNIGTILLLLLLVRSNPNTSKWRKFLMSRVPQYLGTISFGLYLTQAFILHMYGYLIPHWISWAFGAELNNMHTGLWFSLICVGWLISMVSCLCFADVWTREVEGRCIKLVKHLEKLCFKEK